jgi:putative NADH-flavin reductase
MPVLVVGADTAVGEAVVAALAPIATEVRAFVTDPATFDELRACGATVAVGDVSDASHLAGAALGAFSSILVAAAAADARERAFASSPIEVYDAWIEAMRDAGIRRIIWVGDAVPEGIGALDAEVVAVDPAGDAVVERIIALDDAADLP